MHQDIFYKFLDFQFLISTADTVLCTLPLGVLRHSINFFNGQTVPTSQTNFKQICHHNVIQFTPPLPSWKVLIFCHFYCSHVIGDSELIFSPNRRLSLSVYHFRSLSMRNEHSYAKFLPHDKNSAMATKSFFLTRTT